MRGTPHIRTWHPPPPKQKDTEEQKGRGVGFGACPLSHMPLSHYSMALGSKTVPTMNWSILGLDLTKLKQSKWNSDTASVRHLDYSPEKN